MKKIILMLVVIVVVVLNSSCTQEKKWNSVVKSAKQDFAKVLTESILEKTIDEFLVDSSSYPKDLSDLNYFSRQNFFQQHSPWTQDQYWNVAYGTFTAWNGRGSVGYCSSYYFNEAKVDTSLARPLLNFRIEIFKIAKEYLSIPENLNDLYIVHKPMLVEKFKGKEEILVSGLSHLISFIEEDGVEISSYEKEFFQRRKVEGGEPLLLCYKDILLDLINSVRKE